MQIKWKINMITNGEEVGTHIEAAASISLSTLQLKP